MIKSAIFDMDGTIINSMGEWETAGDRYIKSLGLTSDRDFNRKSLGLSLIEVAPILKEYYGIIKTNREIKDGINKVMEDFYFNKSELKSGALEFLDKLKSKGVKMCLATATDRHLVERALKRNKIDGYFNRIFTTAEVGKGKVSPDIYRLACDFLGTDKSETFVFEDAFYAGNTAKKDGFKLACVYDKYESNFEKLKSISDFCIYDYTKTDEFFEFAFK